MVLDHKKIMLKIKKLPLDLHELWEEGAAIMEYDGGMTREKAEIEAYICIANQYDISKEAK